MKKHLTILAVVLFVFSNVSAVQNKTATINIKGFYLSMSRDSVKNIYNKFQNDKIAKYISLEKENYRDIIKLDNEFSSMGNKIEIAYNDSMKAENITFQYKVAGILFQAENKTAQEFVKQIRKEYRLPEMKFIDQGFVKLWTYTNKKAGYKISIDNKKNLRLQKIK